jgi:hypothetical protein
MASTDQGELGKNNELTPKEALLSRLRESYTTSRLVPGVVHEVPLPISPEQALAYSSEAMGDYEQVLRAVVKANNELLFVIDATTKLSRRGMPSPDYVDSTILARYKSGKGAQIVDFSRERRPLVAWDQSTDLRRHIHLPGTSFTVAQASDRTVGIVDDCSNVPIDVFTQKVPIEPGEGPEQLSRIDEGVWCLPTDTLIETIEASLGER